MELTASFITSQVLIALFYATLALTYYLEDRRKILIVNMTGIALQGIAFFILGAHTGLAMAIVGVIRNIIFIIDEKKYGKSEKISKKDIVILAIIYVVTVTLALAGYSSLMSLLIVLVSIMFTYSVWQKNIIVYKVLGIPIATCAFLYNLYVGAVVGIVAEGVIIVAATIGLILSLVKLRKKKGETDGIL